MKTKIEKKFDAVKMAKEIKNVLDKKLSEMTKEDIVTFFKEQRMKPNRIKPSA